MIRRDISLRKVIIVICLLTTAIWTSSCVHYLSETDEGKCIAVRAAFDIGSATTKVNVAKVDTCLKKVKNVYQQEVSVPYADNIADGKFNSRIMKKGISVIQMLKNAAINHQAKVFAGVATAAFRNASNSPEFIQEVQKETGISIRLISHDTEAILGYQATVAAYSGNSEKIVVWDIGGSSMQMIIRQNDQYIIYNGKMAAVSFRDRILSEQNQKNRFNHRSPNPIGKENLERAIKISMDAALNVPKEITNIIQMPGTVVLGIGGVHNESIGKQLKSIKAYTPEGLEKLLNKRIELSDREIGGRYADTDVSNIILVLGFMKQLGIKEVIPIKVNLTDGVLSDQTFW